MSEHNNPSFEDTVDTGHDRITASVHVGKVARAAGEPLVTLDEALAAIPADDLLRRLDERVSSDPVALQASLEEDARLTAEAEARTQGL